MADQITENSMERLENKKPLIIEVASTVMANPEHRHYTADRAVAITLPSGGALIAAIDGVGSGGKNSAEAAQIVQRKLFGLNTQLLTVPTINEGVGHLKNLIFSATEEIKELQSVGGNHNIDTTVTAGIVCRSLDGKNYFFVVANVGDSRMYRCRLGDNQKSFHFQQLTTDHSRVAELVKIGMISPDEAFNHPARNIVTKTVGLLKTPNDIDFICAPIDHGDIFFASSDGLSDNLPQLAAAVHSELISAYNPETNTLNMKGFTFGLAQRAINVQTQTQAPHAKPDDVCVAALMILSPPSKKNVEQ